MAQNQDPNRMVKVPVLPPRLPPGMAPPTGLGVADAFSWDEAVNYSHNNPIQSGEQKERKKSFLGKMGITGNRERLHSDTPNFTFREVPYDTWRKHYAKDKDGNYRGTHAPAQDCLLLPHDREKWASEPPKTEGDKWTRGAVALPVYGDVQNPDQLPQYEKKDSVSSTDQKSLQPPSTEARSNSIIADGKTAQQIIEEAKAKQAAKPKSSWRGSFKKGVETALLGT